MEAAGRRPAVERVAGVDVLLGPSALLYNGVGDQNVGGVINVQPKRADDEPLMRGIASYVSSSSKDLQADIGQRFGPDGLFGVRANLAGMDGQTPIDHQTQRLSFASLGLDLRSDLLKASVDLVNNAYRLMMANTATLRPLADGPIPSPAVFGLPYRVFVSAFGVLATGLTITGMMILMRKRAARLARG